MFDLSVFQLHCKDHQVIKKIKIKAIIFHLNYYYFIILCQGIQIIK